MPSILLNGGITPWSPVGEYKLKKRELWYFVEFRIISVERNEKVDNAKNSQSLHYTVSIGKRRAVVTCQAFATIFHHLLRSFENVRLRQNMKKPAYFRTVLSLNLICGWAVDKILHKTFESRPVGKATRCEK